MTEKLTLDDVRRMFGGAIPKVAKDIIDGADEGVTLDDLRPELEALAAPEHADPRRRRFRVLFGKELNGEPGDEQR
ncbi:hypothetical protein [Paracoccus sp. T5]|uniref:hypothetical protein n=1 Tax=Paracoccus sp. T5 TaxID=3402161 RepID=UPI003ADBC01E